MKVKITNTKTNKQEIRELDLPQLKFLLMSFFEAWHNIKYENGIVIHSQVGKPETISYKKSDII